MYSLTSRAALHSRYQQDRTCTLSFRPTRCTTPVSSRHSRTHSCRRIWSGQFRRRKNCRKKSFHGLLSTIRVDKGDTRRGQRLGCSFRGDKRSQSQYQLPDRRSRLHTASTRKPRGYSDIYQRGMANMSATAPVNSQVDKQLFCGDACFRYLLPPGYHLNQLQHLKVYRRVPPYPRHLCSRSYRLRTNHLRW